MVDDIAKTLNTMRYRETAKTATLQTLANHSAYEDKGSNLKLLLKCQEYWQSLEPLRRDRSRNIRYKNGDQWSDIVEDPDNGGQLVREDVVLSRAGRVPLKHNFIQQYIRNICGQLLNNKSQSVVYARSSGDQELSEMLTNTLQSVLALNQSDKINISVMEELLLSGIACVKTRFDYWCEKDRTDGKMDLVNINRLFFNTDIEDPRLTDLGLIGEIHDYDLDSLLKNFARSPSEANKLREMYRLYDSINLGRTYSMTDTDKLALQFTLPRDSSKCRVFEVWQRLGRWVTYTHDYADGSEQIVTMSITEVEAINGARQAEAERLGVEFSQSMAIYAEARFEHYWLVSFITPDGTTIKRMETPYRHQEHPYTMAVMPMIDGVVKSGVGDLIDMQRYINRLIVMIDFIMGSSAKGVLMIPESAIPDGYSVDDFASEYVKANGVIVYKQTPGIDAPFQISTNATNVGGWEMLNMQLSLIDKISGVSGAIQGQSARAGTPSSLYAQQAQNSALNLKVLFNVFELFVQARDEKMLKVLMQYYSEPRHVNISGKSFTEVAATYQPEMAQKIIDFNITVSQSADTPVFRQIADDVMLQLVRDGQIPLEMYLKNSSLPFADKLLQDMQAAKEQTAANQGAGVTPNAQPTAEQMAALQEEAAAANPRATELASQFVMGNNN